MKYEMINEKGRVVMSTSSPSACYGKEEVEFMYNAGYKVKLDGKIISLKKAQECVR